MAEVEDDKMRDGVDGDAENAENAEDTGASGGGLNAKKIILFVVLPLFLIAGSGTVAYFMGYLDSLLGIEINCEEIEQGDHHYEKCQKELATAEGQEGMAPGFYFAIPDIRVNLNTPPGEKKKFLFLVVQLELPDEHNLKLVEQYMPRIVDHFQTYLREIRIEDLQGSAGIYRLRLELLERVNAAAPGIDVRDVLFQEMLVQ